MVVVLLFGDLQPNQSLAQAQQRDMIGLISDMIDVTNSLDATLLH
jgi:hypothetical protein